MNVLIRGGGRPYVDGDSLDDRAPLVFTLDGVLTPAECAEQIARIEALGPTVAPITTGSGFVMRTDLRNNTRVIVDDLMLAEQLFARVAPVLPRDLCNMDAVGANERFRCYRYEPGQRFAPHLDGAFVRAHDERSLLTFMIYLNDGFAGGETRFLEDSIAVVPRTGMALLFQHRLWHEGSAVTSGVKYALRSDVMYRARGA